MRQLASACEQIAVTTKKLEKTAIVAAYLRARTTEAAAVSSVFLSGRPFPVWDERILQVGGAMLWRVAQELTGKSDKELTAAYRRHGDLGAAAGEVLPEIKQPGVSVLETQQAFQQIAATRGAAAKEGLVKELLSRVSPLEAKYLIKIMTGDLRIGLKESLVEEAIARAYEATLPQVQRANMQLGDIGETLRFAAQGRLGEVRMRLFHPLGFMLAGPAATAEEALGGASNAWVEDKYDGIRAQAHCRAGEVRIFSRTRDDVTESFPEVATALSGLSMECVLDGEILAWRDGRALPFSELQQRLGRKKVSDELQQRVPVAYSVFDLLYSDGELLIDRPLEERARILESALNAPRKEVQVYGMEAQSDLFVSQEPRFAEIIRSPVTTAKSADQLESCFEAALERGNEGLMIKDPLSPYTPGRPGRSWLKLKRELARLDVVVTAAEYGHGKRVRVLSDYTFAVRDGDRLRNIGKAYSGLTDAEIAEMTQWFLDHTTRDEGFRRAVEPKIVLEVAFNAIMQSERHDSGFALRFPRIVRLRPDKPVEEVDTLERVREIFAKQQATYKGGRTT
jgi:DNA ligase 1